MRFRRLAVALVAASLVPASAAVAGPSPVLNPDVVPDVAQSALGCDPIDPAACLLPFPNDFFTVADATTATGRRVDFKLSATPRTGTDVTSGEVGGEGKPVDPTELNRNDGFSPGSPVLTYVKGIDLHQTWGTAALPHAGAPNEQGSFDHRDQLTDIGLSLDPEAPIVVLNARTGERHPFWSEVDTHPDTTDDRRSLIIRPARNFDEGERYIVALRNLKDAAGQKIPAGAAFRRYRDGLAIDARAAHLNGVFSTLRSYGVGTQNLYLAWDFTVASERNLTERMLHIRDDAFGRILGDTDLADRVVQGTAPDFVVDATAERVDSWTDSYGVAHTQKVRRVEGRVTVPNYLDRVQQTEGHVSGGQALPYDAPTPLSRLLYLPDGDQLPDQNPAEPTVNVPFMCDVPLDEGASYGTLYGHGLLGSRDQLGDVKWPRRFGFAGCALDWWGMSTADLPTIATIIADFSHFGSLPDRAQQGFLNFLFAGRAMVHPDGFAADPAFRQDGASLLVTDDGTGTKLFYDGNSQGGIMGGSLVAVSPDIHRGILGVTGMNYSTLLQRSVDWEDLYAIPFYANYQDPLERQILFGMMQMLWDRGEANGYAAHMTDDPPANTPTHDVMLQVAWADHQVTNHAAEVEARTVGAKLMVPGLPVGRHWERAPYSVPTSAYPHQGSSLIYWDSGNAMVPNGNIPADEAGDPHGHPRSEPAAGWQEAHFLLTGWNVDVCGGGDYLTLRHPANGGTPSCHEPAYAPGS